MKEEKSQVEPEKLLCAERNEPIRHWSERPSSEECGSIKTLTQIGAHHDDGSVVRGGFVLSTSSYSGLGNRNAIEYI
jgi:hypothetical protein